MKFSKLLIGACFLTSFLTYAGDKGGNGGGGVVCPDSVELYDFYEGRSPIIHNIKTWQPDARITRDEYLKLAMNRIKNQLPWIYSGVTSRLDKILSIPDDQLLLPVEIPLTGDADIPFIKKGCQYQQVANWNERIGRLIINKDLFDRMSSMDQAGLLIHEALYKEARESLNRSSNSDEVRKLVAKIFSELPLSKEDSDLAILTRDVLLPKDGVCKFTVEYAVNVHERHVGNVFARFQHGDNYHLKEINCADLKRKSLELIFGYEAKIGVGQITFYYKVNGKTFYTINKNLSETFALRLQRNAGAATIEPSQMYFK